MAFRIGKSIMLNFGDNLEPTFIIIGLALLLLIGPFLRGYMLVMTTPNFKLSKQHLVELLPFVMIFIASFFADKNDINNPTTVIIFGSIIIFIYLHFATYIFIAIKIVLRLKKQLNNSLQTKSQKAILDWLTFLVIGFVIIWVSYFLNIIEDAVPYIIGPIMYSIVIYFLSYKAYLLKITDIDGEVFKVNENAALFKEISDLVITNKMYLKADVSLTTLSKLLGVTTQKTSEIINQYAQKNFNDFINSYRIDVAKNLLNDSKNDNLTIASIAFDAGFSSLSSFNTAFKKFVGVTPSSFRKSVNQ
ncbi:helix-turn-helix domain-containing protein [Polaribacter sp. Asnod6-C07]|uniref:helix-turn-helix domain-containing protein n=1 Tax=Polaribacter sp. Asnod6-C07 TaxID=3160582 RepID=UPI0038671F30